MTPNEIYPLQPRENLPCYGRRSFVRQRRARRISVVAVVIAAVCVGTWLAVNRRAGTSTGTNIVEKAQTERAIQNAVLDLRGWSAARSDQAAPNRSGNRLELHGEHLALSIYLPMGRQPGKYEVEILRPKGAPLPRLKATARIEDANTVVSTRADLSKLTSGNYLIGIRQPPWDWRCYPVTIR